jgi:hypothetical protein
VASQPEPLCGNASPFQMYLPHASDSLGGTGLFHRQTTDWTFLLPHNLAFPYSIQFRIGILYNPFLMLEFNLHAVTHRNP